MVAAATATTTKPPTVTVPINYEVIQKPTTQK
jgi:hypothetical protein